MSSKPTGRTNLISMGVSNGKGNSAYIKPQLAKWRMLKYLGFEGSIQNRLEAWEQISKLKESIK
ncbi:MAG: hypothetical protein IH875_10650 [Candidatus Dadabacteria bacterium]|nr:hypothetical protein [Candidatus Dadabacteria bacterium]